MTTSAAVAALLFFVAAFFWQRQAVLRRDAYIRSFPLPRGLFEKLRKKHPGLTVKECQLVSQGLRQFFLAYLKSGRRFVSMPSQIADDLWHEFILYTKNYETFCQKAFGRFLHHTPAVVLTDSRQSNTGLRRCWWHLCREENIDPRLPSRLPLLFALDAKLDVPDGFRYVADCASVRKLGATTGNAAAVHCGGDFSSSSIDGGTDGLEGGTGGDGDGCGGGGCGGD